MKVESQASAGMQFWNRAGIFLSSLCLVHCILIPVILLFFPFVGMALVDEGSFFHRLMFFTTLLAAVTAFYFGYRIHNDFKPLTWMSVGLLLFGVGVFFFSDTHVHTKVEFHWELVFSLLGSAALIRGHLLNHSKRHKAEHKDCSSCQSIGTKSDHS